MTITHVWPEGIAADRDSLTVSATVERPDGSRWRSWYRLPAACGGSLSTSSDSFLLGVLFRAMATATDVRIHGAVSPSLLVNLVEFQRAWACWRPGVYTPVDLSADREREDPRAGGDEILIPFSGGADSAFTAFRYRTGNVEWRAPRVVAGMMVHGFDIPIEDAGAFACAADRSARMLASLGMDLIPVATNFREQPGDWEDAHGTTLASCLTLLKGRFSRGLIASSYPYSALILPYGSNPVTDGMMSSESFRISHDGADVAKIEKVKAISGWPEARRYLRVCWEGAQKDRNCGRCQKCVWTLLVFRMIGAGLPECFERDIGDSEIARLSYPDEGTLNSMKRLVARAKADSVSASWLSALQRSIVSNRLRMAARKSRAYRLAARALRVLR
ncbi:MAG: hypothetical protein ACHQPI_02305 [Thermoanaerobaculia bacterium]